VAGWAPLQRRIGDMAYAGFPDRHRLDRGYDRLRSVLALYGLASGSRTRLRRCILEALQPQLPYLLPNAFDRPSDLGADVNRRELPC